MTTIIGSTGDLGRSIMAIQSDDHGTRHTAESALLAGRSFIGALSL
jgi:hypothetical protein